jgi:uncharacterized protein (TIGR03435 family)
MIRPVTGTIVMLLASRAAFGQVASGQPAPARPEFEVASIKPAPPPGDGKMVFRFGNSGGPGSRDPGLFACTNCTLSMLVLQAYELKPYQLSGGPSFFSTERFNISAKVPEKTTKEQYLQMQQNLLADRFGLKIHREQKEMPVYELVVAKGGPKFKESAPPPPQDDAAPAALPALGGRGPRQLDKDGFPVLPPGRGTNFIMMPGRARMQATQETMEHFIVMLSQQIGKPVTDGTDLKGKYDFTLTFAPENSMMPGRMAFAVGGALPPQPPPPSAGEGGARSPLPDASDGEGAPTLFAAVQQQLGLKLEPKKGMVSILVVDHVEKVPTEN